MSTVHPVLTDDLLKNALDYRAAGPHAPGELVRDVIAAVETMPQGRRLGLQITWPRLLPVVLAAALPLAALIGVALLAGGRHVVPITADAGIALVQADYTCGDAPCVLPGEDRDDGSDHIPGLQADLPRIVAIDPDGDTETPLIDVPGTVNQPTGWSDTDPRSNWLVGPAVRWSPDGTRLAFRLFNDAPGIYVADGGELTQMVELPLDRLTGMSSAGLEWSPDGTRIAYTYPYGGRQSELYLVDVADGSVTDLRVKATRALAWSPDGSRIAFARSSNANGGPQTGLYVVGADGSGETQLADAIVWRLRHVEGLGWSPDGSRIAFRLLDQSQSGPDLGGLYTIEPDGSGLRRLTGGPEVASLDPLPTPPRDAPGACCVQVTGDEPVEWSPDGVHVAVLGDGGIAVVNADGSGERRIGTRFAYDVDWSPDGSRLVYAAGPAWTAGLDEGHEISSDDWSSIYLINADGTGDRWLADGEYPDWSPGVSR